LTRSKSTNFAKSISNVSAQTIAKTFGLGIDKATEISLNERMLDSSHKGESYHDQTQIGCSFSLSGNARVNLGKSANTNNNENLHQYLKDGEVRIGGSLSGRVSGNVNATNSDNAESNQQFSDSESLAEAHRKFEKNIEENDYEKVVKSREEQIRNSSDSLMKKDVAERAKKRSGEAAINKLIK